MLRSVALVVVTAVILGACSSGRTVTTASNPSLYDYRYGSATTATTTTSSVGRSADPKVYTGPRSNVMDCGRLTLAQRQFFPLHRYGCEDLPTPGDTE